MMHSEDYKIKRFEDFLNNQGDDIWHPGLLYLLHCEKSIIDISGLLVVLEKVIVTFSGRYIEIVTRNRSETDFDLNVLTEEDVLSILRKNGVLESIEDYKKTITPFEYVPCKGCERIASLMKIAD